MSFPSSLTVRAPQLVSAGNVSPAWASVVAAWQASLRSHHTRIAYTADVRLFSEWLADNGGDMNEVSRGQIDLYARFLETRYRPATVARKLAALASLFEYLESEGVIATNPTTKVKRPRVSADDQQLTPARTIAEVRQLLAAATSPCDRALVLVLVMMGLRVSEAIGLDLDGLEVDSGHTTTVIEGKGGRRTRAVVPPPVVAAFTAIEDDEQRTTGPVFARNGIRWNRNQATRALHRLGRAANLTGPLRPHQLRATAITVALELGEPLHKVQTFARHQDPTVTQRYNANRQALDGSPAYALASALSD